MKRLVFSLALLAACIQPSFAQVGTSNCSGSGFLNNDLVVGRCGTPGPAELNLRLGGTGWTRPFRFGYPVGVRDVQGIVLSTPAIVGGYGGLVGTSCGMSSCALPAIAPGCGFSPCVQPVIAPRVMLSQPALSCPSDAFIVPGFCAPALIDR